MLRIPHVALSLFAVFALNYFAYVYFFDFNEGVGSAPFIIKAAKDIAYAALVATFLLLPLSKPSVPKQWLFVPFAIIISLASLFHAPQTGLAAQLWENGKNTVIFVATYWAMFLLSQPQRDEFTKTLFGVILVSSIVQLLFSYAFRSTGRSLWMDDLYVGFMANPNSFALLLNLAAALCLTCLVYSRGPLLVVAALIGVAMVTFGTIQTASSSQFVILIFMACYAAGLSIWARRRALLKLMAALLVILSVSVWFGQKTVDSVIVPISDLITNALGLKPIETANQMQAIKSKEVSPEVDRELSVSFTNRREMTKRALSVLSKGTLPALIGDFDNREYLKMDGQFWVFLANDGLLSVAAFGLAALFVYVASLPMIKTGSPLTFGLHLMIVVFGITLLASRVLQYFPLNWLFFLIAGLLMADTSGTFGRVGKRSGWSQEGKTSEC